ncbi:uncharacterized protein LOC106765913 [Vigna radiata var. radiata]|uniref:Uncharacterized protein LOC106765913 n=1 Tax=Vigna radiata var. radiata TaxID=3916 RepID=A0A1S3UJF2_VIGRR|nr:uncharacterized protein LOC106765913 [Vigna radiata var. radiata]
MASISDSLPRFLETIEVYISADKMVNGEVDWYRILGVQPLADEETIRRRYRKLALTLHPDKNKSVEDGSKTSPSTSRSGFLEQQQLVGIGHSSPPTTKCHINPVEHYCPAESGSRSGINREHPVTNDGDDAE